MLSSTARRLLSESEEGESTDEHGAHTWYGTAAEYDQAEAIVCICLVLVAIFWELVIHHLHHKIEHSAGGYGVRKAYEVTSATDNETESEEHEHPHDSHEEEEGEAVPI